MSRSNLRNNNIISFFVPIVNSFFEIAEKFHFTTRNIYKLRAVRIIRYIAMRFWMWYNEDNEKTGGMDYGTWLVWISDLRAVLWTSDFLGDLVCCGAVSVCICEAAYQKGYEVIRWYRNETAENAEVIGYIYEESGPAQISFLYEISDGYHYAYTAEPQDKYSPEGTWRKTGKSIKIRSTIWNWFWF